MAKTKVTTVLTTDDLSGAELPESDAVSIPLVDPITGERFVFDSTADTRDKVGKALAKYLAVARPAGRSGSSNGSSRNTEAAAMRGWLRENGYPDLGDRGRLPEDGVAAYRAAHADS